MWKIVFSVLAAVFAVGYAGMMPGGFQDADPTSPSVQNALNFAVVKHNLRSNNLFVSQAIRVVKARSQVVAGMKYVMTVEMGKTPCRKGSAAEVCLVHTDPAMAQAYNCTFTVLNQPWLNEIKLTDEKCLTGNL